MNNKKIVQVIAILLVLFVFVFYVGTWVQISLLNADLYGRLTETKSFTSYPSNKKDVLLPTIRLVINRVIPDENKIEATLEFYADDELKKMPTWKDVKNLTVGIRDASSSQSVFLSHVIICNLIPKNPGETGVAFQSERFTLPYLPSVEGFPYDDICLFVLPYLTDDLGAFHEFNFEIQKAFSGRLLSISGDVLNPRAILSRPKTEIILAIVGGFTFLILSIFVIIILNQTSKDARSWETLLTFAGYIVGATGFRELIGVTRSYSVSAFEIIVFGVPIVGLTISMLIAIIRQFKITKTINH